MARTYDKIATFFLPAPWLDELHRKAKVERRSASAILPRFSAPIGQQMGYAPYAVAG